MSNWEKQSCLFRHPQTPASGRCVMPAYASLEAMCTRRVGGQYWGRDTCPQFRAPCILWDRHCGLKQVIFFSTLSLERRSFTPVFRTHKIPPPHPFTPPAQLCLCALHPTYCTAKHAERRTSGKTREEKSERGHVVSPGSGAGARHARAKRKAQEGVVGGAGEDQV